MPSPSNFTRDQISQIVGNNPRLIKAFELMMSNVNTDIPAQISALQALTQIFTSTAPGIVPASGGGKKYLRADGTWSQSTDYWNADYLNLTSGYTPAAPAVGDMWTDGNAALNFQITANIAAQLGRDNYIYGKASSAITKGQLCVFTGAVGASGVITFAQAGAGITIPKYIIGIAAESIALNGFGLVQVLGDLRGFDTTGSTYGETWADGDILYYNPASGGLTNVYPASGIIVTVAAITNAGSAGSGSVIVRPTTMQRATAGIGIAVTQDDTGLTIADDLTAYTVATLPAGTQGQRAHVTDATAPVFLAPLVGGGAVVCPAFFNGTNWVAG